MSTSPNIIEKILYSDSFEIKHKDALLLTENNLEIIGNKLVKLGYTWYLGESIFEFDYFCKDIIIHIDTEDKTIAYSELDELDEDDDTRIINYVFYKIDL